LASAVAELAVSGLGPGDWHTAGASAAGGRRSASPAADALKEPLKNPSHGQSNPDAAMAIS